ncbi:MAG: hypothetical protein ACREOH_16885 [Candidatus Entotheonellia bacterium]
MTRWLRSIVAVLAFPALLLLCCDEPMALVGYNDLQTRSAYQPIIQQQGGRFIYTVDRANTGMHVLELTGAARAIANFP